MASAQVELLIKASTKDAENAVKSFTSNASRSLSTVEDAFKGLKAVGIAAVGFLAGREIVGALFDMIDAAQESQDAANQLAFAFRAAGHESALAVKEFGEFASSLQQVTIFEDDAIVAAAAHIETLTQLDKEGLKVATASTLDLAAALGVDLSTASDLMVKAANGNVGALKRYGIEVKAGATDSETLANAIATINAKFGGAAANQVNTYSGAIAQAKNNFGDIGETIGTVIIENEALVNTIKAASVLFAELSAGVEKNQGVITSLVNGGIYALAFSLEGLIVIIESVDNFFTLAINSVSNFVTGLKEVAIQIKSIATLDFAEIEASEQRYAAHLRDNQKALDKRNVLYKDASDAVSKFAVSIDTSTDSSKALTKQTDNLGRSVAGVGEEVSKAIEDLEKKLENAGKSQIEIILAERDARLKLIEDSNLAVSRSAELREKVELDATTRIAKANQDAFEKDLEHSERLRKAEEDRLKIAEDRVKTLSSDIFNFNPATQGGELGASPTDGAAVGTGLVTSMLTGAQGAVDLISQGFGAIANTFIPGIGGAVAAIVEVFAQGPEKIREMLTQFLDAIPSILTNIVFAAVEFVRTLKDKIPEFITSLIDALPDLIEALVVQLPEAVIAFTQAMVDAAPKIAFRLAAKLGEGLINVLIGGFEMILNALWDVVTLGMGEDIKIERIHGSGDGLGAFGLASGGTVPNGFNSDNFPARLTSGEMVVPRDDVQSLRDFLASERNGTSSSNEALVTSLVAALDKSTNRNLSINLKIGERELSNTLLSINRQGFRTA